MEIFEELNDIYNELRSHGVVRTKKELAEILGVSDKGIIKAMKGDPQYATPSLRTKMLRFRDEKLGPSEPPQPDAKEAALDRLLTNMNDAQASRRRFIRGEKTPGKLTINPATYRCGTGVGMNMAYG